MNNLSATDIGIIASKIDTGWETAFSDYLTRLVSRLLIFSRSCIWKKIASDHVETRANNVVIMSINYLLCIQNESRNFYFSEYKVSFTKLEETRNRFCAPSMWNYLHYLYITWMYIRFYSKGRILRNKWLNVSWWNIFLFAEARARINGQTDIYVKTGSLLTLTCLMSQGPHDLGTVAWYRGSQPVVTSPHSENDVNGEPRITVETEWSDALTSRWA